MNYPIISSEQSDTIKGTIVFDINQENIEEGHDDYLIQYTLNIDSKFLKEKIAEGNISLSIATDCRDTYYFDYKSIGFEEKLLEFQKLSYLGQYTLQL